MGDKQRKLKDKASRNYADGDLKDALKLYVRVVEEDPTELQCQIKIGDIHRRLNNQDAAVDAYFPVAKAYAADGLLLKSIAVCKMILAVDSDHSDTQILLRGLSAKRRGPARKPPAPAPVTLQGMGISVAGAQFPDYGMVDLSNNTQSADIGSGGGMRTIDPEQISGPAPVITGRPVAPPRKATPPPQVAWPQPGQTPAPKVAWPAGATPPPQNVSWPATPAAETPEVIVGERLEESALDIVVDTSSLGLVPELAEPDSAADLAAREVEAAMAAFSEDPAAAPAAPQELELNIEEPTDIEAAMLAAVAQLADGPDEPVGLDDLPIDLTDVVKSGDLVPPLELSKVSEDIDASCLDSGSAPQEDVSRSQIPLFSDLPKNAFIELMVQMTMREVQPNDIIIEEGETGSSFFVLVSGGVRVQRKDEAGQDVVLAHLAEGAFFGEMALLQDGARTATVVAEASSQLFEISKEVLDRIVARYPSVANVLRNFYRQRLLSTTMATHPLFRPFTIDERRVLMELFKSRSFKKGDVLVQEGKKGSGLFLLLYGTVEVVKTRDEGVPKVLAELMSGDLFGEMSLLTNQPTMATVRAISDCFILRLGKKKFDELIMTHPQILELVSVISDERQGLNDLILAQGMNTGAVLV